MGTRLSSAEIAVETANTKTASSGTEKKALQKKVLLGKDEDGNTGEQDID